MPSDFQPLQFNLPCLWISSSRSPLVPGFSFSHPWYFIRYHGYSTSVYFLELPNWQKELCPVNTKPHLQSGKGKCSFTNYASLNQSDLFSTRAGSLAQKSWHPVNSIALCTPEWKSWSPETFIVRATQSYTWITSPQWTHSFTQSHGYWNVSNFWNYLCILYGVLFVSHFFKSILSYMCIILWLCTLTLYLIH